MTGNIQPQAVELERAIIGSILQSKEAVFSALAIIDSESFYHPRNQMVMEAILKLHDKSQPIDLLTVVEQLKKDGKLDEVGGPYEISKYTNEIASAANIETHCRIVQQKYMKRRQAQLAQDLVRLAFDDTEDPFETDEYITREQLDISNRVVKGSSVKTPKDVTPELLQTIDKAGEMKGLTGIPTGIIDKDRIYGGRQKTDLIIKAGRPSMGKTADALCEALHAAKQGYNSVFFSLEMGKLQLVQRLVSIESRIPLSKIQRGGLTDEEFERLHYAIGIVEGLPIHIIDKAGISLRELVTMAMRLKQMGKCDIIFIDYLQLITVTDGNKNNNREQEISLISRSLKRLAKDLDVPVIALSQLSRAVETRGGSKKPMLSDLRESGAIEQDADIVEFLYRPEYYGIETNEDGESMAGVGYLLIEKHRNGSTGPVKMSWIGNITKYDNFNGMDYSPPPTTLKPNPDFEHKNLPYKDNDDDVPF